MAELQASIAEEKAFSEKIEEGFIEIQMKGIEVKLLEESVRALNERKDNLTNERDELNATLEG